jgi:hypothetical protein
MIVASLFVLAIALYGQERGGIPGALAAGVLSMAAIVLMSAERRG